MTPYDLAQTIDHTVLKPDAVRADIERVCKEALAYHFFAVCVAPSWVALAAGLLADSPVRVATVIGFPHGDTLAAAKASETRLVIAAGASEVDMVIPFGAVKDGNDQTIRAHIDAVVEAAWSAQKTLVKVIIETSRLTDAEKERVCRIAKEAGADFVKTSTGFSGGGATVEDVALMRRAVGSELGIKASGGIRDLTAARAMLRAGASRLGSSASVAIVDELIRKQG